MFRDADEEGLGEEDLEDSSRVDDAVHEYDEEPEQIGQ